MLGAALALMIVETEGRAQAGDEATAPVKSQQAQEKDVKRDWSWLSIQQHSLDKNYTNEPAIVQYTNPDDGKTSYAIHAAVLGTMKPEESDWEYTLGAELHKDTVVDKKQDTRMLSLAAETTWGDVEEDSRVYVPTLSVTYKRDDVKNNESVMLIGQLDFLAGGRWAINFIPKHYQPEQLNWYWTPVVALEEESIVDAEDNGPTGSVFRVHGGIGLSLYPWAKTFGSRLSLMASYAYWRDLKEDNDIDEGGDNHGLAKYALKWELTKPKKQPEEKKLAVTVSLERVDGEDPRTNQADQSYNRFVLGVKF